MYNEIVLDRVKFLPHTYLLISCPIQNNLPEILHSEPSKPTNILAFGEGHYFKLGK